MTEAVRPVAALSLAEKRALAAELLRRKAERRAARLSYGQRAWWFLHRLEPDNASLAVPFAARIRSPVDVEALTGAWKTLVGRHAALRTTFGVEAGEPVQRVHPTGELCVTHLAVPDMTWEEVEALLAEEARRPFDLERGPVLRVVLASRADDDHGLLVVVHHVAADLWSMVVLLHELRLLLAGEPLGPAPGDYAGYVEAEAALVAGPRGVELWRFWSGQLAGELPVLALPLDRPRPAVLDGAGASRSFRIPTAVGAALRSLARERGVTLFATLLAAYRALLLRLTGQRDLTVGTLAAKGRSESGFSGVVGFLDNPVVLRQEIVPRASFDALLAETRDAVFAALAHQDLPYSLLIERLSPSRDLARAAVFQTMFILQSPQLAAERDLLSLWLGFTGEREVPFAGLSLAAARLDRGATTALAGRLDLTLSVSDLGDDLFATLHYATRLLDPATIERWSEAFELLLAQLAGDPTVSVADFALLSTSARHQVTAEWNDAETSFGGGGCLHDLFLAQARLTPHAPAVLGPGDPLTYGELEARARRLARRLAYLGVGPEVRVGVCLEPSPEMVVALFGILMAGGAYVPIDPRYPAARRELIVEDAGIRLLLTDELDGEEGEPAAAGPESLAYVIYTSGSTGRPKGVMIDHAAAANTVVDIVARFGVSAGDRVFAVSSLSFDLSVFDVFGTLAAGGALILPEPSPHPNPAAWSASMLRHGATVWNSAPPLLEMLREQADRGARVLPETLRLVMLSGDWIAVTLPGAVWSQVEAASVVSLGGATEASIWSIVHRVTPGEPARPSIPYGRPLANQSFHVLDPELRPAPVGVIGELSIGGVGLARGYLGRPDLTAERFLPDGVSGSSGRRLYRTGDLGRYLPDGEIEFLGRADHQVKIRGFRVELGEIEAQLARLPGVREALVVVRDDLPGGRQLVGYVTGSGLEPPQPEELRRALRQVLADYMVPAFLLPMAAFPLSPNGKIDRRALPVPAPATARDGLRTPTEEILAAVWGEVLGLGAALGRDAHFFELGGHSLKAAQVAARLADRCGVEVSLRQVFEAPLLADLAEAVDRAFGAGAVALPPLQPAARTGAMPLSFAQERLWFVEQLEPETGAYNLAVGVEIHGPLAPPLLAAALAGIVRRHETLRTAFVDGPDGPLQAIAPEVEVPLPVIDLSALPEGARAAEREALCRREAGRQLDLTVAPLLRLALFAEGPRAWFLLLNLHHIVSDGWSMGVFLQEIARFYEAAQRGAAPRLPSLPIQYADFAAWQRTALDDEALRPHLDYWRRQLAGAPAALALPTDRPRPAVRTLAGASRSRLVAPELARDLNGLARRSGATLFMTALAAFQLLLARFSGQHDVVVGTDTANRGRQELEGLIGFFVNHPVLRTRLGGDPTFDELLAQVRRTTLEAFAHQDLPFDRLVLELAPVREAGRTPLFQVLFVLQNVPVGNLAAGDLSLIPRAIDSGRSKFDLLYMLWETEEGMRETWTYSTELYDDTTISRLSAQLAALLGGIVARPEERLSSFDTLTPEERQQQVMERQQRENQDVGALRLGRRRAVDLTAVRPVNTEVVSGGETRCLLVTPSGADVDLVAWAASDRAFIDQSLAVYGALLLRGFSLSGVADFERFAQAVTDDLFGDYGDLPRAGLGGKVYTSTPYPPEEWILYHNESAHLDRWPQKQLFHCVTPAESGGETPLADCRRVLARLRPEIRRPFAEKGVMYVRNFTPGIDVPWQEFFHTGERSEVEAACREAGLAAEWTDDGGLRTRKVCPAVLRHPKTGEEIFFNQIQAHHVSCLPSAVRESLFSMLDEEALPRNVYFGDGSSIPFEVMEEIVALYHEVAYSTPWQQGDLMLLDNMLVAHARAPFGGARKIVVAMGDMVGQGEVLQR